MPKYFYIAIGILVGLSIIILMVVGQLEKSLLDTSKDTPEPLAYRPPSKTPKQPHPPPSPPRSSEDSLNLKETSVQETNRVPVEHNLRQAGTSLWGNTASAVIEDLTQGTQGSYRLGDMIKGFRITKILEESVTLTKKGQDVVLELTKGSASLALEEFAWKIGDDSWELSTEKVAEKISDFDQYVGQIVVYQQYQDAEPSGFRIRHITEGNDLEAIGIENGDVIKEINGLEINDITDVLRAIYELSNETDFQVEVERNNQRKTLYYQLDQSSNLLAPIISNLFTMAVGGEE